MFAITTADALHISDSSSVKRGPPLIPACLDLEEPPVATSWTPDFSHIYIASAHTIRKFNPSRNILADVYTSAHPNEGITSVVAQDANTLFFSTSTHVHLLERGSIVETFQTHTDPITSLSLSYGGQFLASLSPTNICVYDLLNNEQLLLEGLPPRLSTACFHFCLPSRLLVAGDDHIHVYDITNPGMPQKVIEVPKAEGEYIFSLCSSPYSEALVVAATTNGTIVLLDLDRENQPVRTFQIDDGLATVHFSPEGAGIYACTTSGNLLSIDLRALDKPPKPIPVGTGDQPILTFSLQPKVKSTNQPKTNSTTPMATEASSAARVSATAPKVAAKASVSPTKSRAPVVASSSSARTSSRTTKPTSAPVTSITKTANKAVLSPSRDPHGNIAADTLPAKASAIKGKQPIAKSTSSPILASKPDRNGVAVRVTRTKASPTSAEHPATQAVRKPSSTSTLKSSVSSSNGLAPSTRVAPSKTSPLRRSQTNPSVSSAPARKRSGTGSTTASGSHTPASRPTSAVSLAASTGSSSSQGSLSVPSSSKPLRPSTEKPTPSNTKALANPKSSALRVSPEPAASEGLVDKGKSKSVGFETDDIVEEDEEADDDTKKVKISSEDNPVDLRIQLSPLRRPAGGQNNSPSSAIPSSIPTGLPGSLWLNIPPSASNEQAQGAPLDLFTSTTATTPAATPQELLRTIVQDTMYDYQQETKSELMGLHLDLVKMGRTWKAELRALMDEYVGDLKELREENQRLRKENDRLRKDVW